MNTFVIFRTTDLVSTLQRYRTALIYVNKGNKYPCDSDINCISLLHVFMLTWISSLPAFRSSQWMPTMWVLLPMMECFIASSGSSASGWMCTVMTTSLSSLGGMGSFPGGQGPWTSLRCGCHSWRKLLPGGCNHHCVNYTWQLSRNFNAYQIDHSSTKTDITIML